MHNAMQMALLLEPHKIRLFNVTSKVDEPESLSVDTAGKQWLVTPNGAALLAMRYDHALVGPGTSRGWVLDAYTLEDCPPVQGLFQQVAAGAGLAHGMHALPARVCFHFV